MRLLSYSKGISDEALLIRFTGDPDVLREPLAYTTGKLKDKFARELKNTRTAKTVRDRLHARDRAISAGIGEARRCGAGSRRADTQAAGRGIRAAGMVEQIIGCAAELELCPPLN